MTLDNVIKAITVKASLANKLGLPKDKKEYKVFKKVMRSIDKENKAYRVALVQLHY